MNSTNGSIACKSRNGKRRDADEEWKLGSRECRIMDMAFRNTVGSVVAPPVWNAGVASVKLDRETDYNRRKYQCDVLDKAWRFSYSHNPIRNGEPYCIYGIADPRDHVIRYVGWTQVSLNRRLSQHIRNPVGRHMARWLGWMVASGIRPEIIAIEWCRDHDARERTWIARMRAVGTLLNVTDGGDRGGRRRCIGSRLRTVGGPVRTFTAEEIAELNEARSRH